ncbi:hypothetical protein ACFWF7_36045 [Nocardia sp. NPDC060256]|uniref:hypothetical protein n=1 Tax=unclassified Nocardia TaxID=2637762 RepID=UPI0036697563
MNPGTGRVPDSSDDQPELDQHAASDGTSTVRVVLANSDSSGPVFPRWPRGEVEPGPEDPIFSDLIFEPFRRWAIAVAENFVFLAKQPHSQITVDECWIDTELALCVRYSTARGKFGGRWADLYNSHVSWLPPLNPMPTGFATSARWQASNFLDIDLDGGEPEGCQWTEDDGRKWCGPPPAAGWLGLGDPTSRVVTIQPPNR